MPNRLWSLIASALWPQPDSSIAWAIVTAAGMPYRLCMAMAPGAIWLMNSCWAAVPGTCVASADGTFLVYDGPDGAGELRVASAAGACSPGITAVPAPWDAREPCRARDPLPGLGSLPALDPCRAWDPCRACDPCRAWDPCRACDPCRAWDPPCAPACAGRGPVARPGRGAAGPAGEVGHRARHRHHALRAEVSPPGLLCPPSWSYLPSPSRHDPGPCRVRLPSPPSLGDRRERRPRHGRAACARLPLAQEPGRLDLRRTTCGRRAARGRTALLAHRAEQLAVVDEAVHALRRPASRERVRVDRQVRRESPPTVRRAPGE